jgi:hypothetical protein
MTKKEALKILGWYNASYDTLKAKDLLPDPGNPVAEKKFEQLLKQDRKFDSDEITFMGIMNLKKLQEKSPGLAAEFMSY